MWNRLSHAVAPVWRHQPEHAVADCEVCATRSRNQVQHIKSHVPLEYQRDALAQTHIDRFSLVLNADAAADSSAHGKTLSDVFRNEFQCRINRVLDQHQPATLAPSTSNVDAELAALVANGKGGDRVLLYWHVGPSSNMASVDPLAWVEPRATAAAPLFVWLLLTRPLPDDHPLLTHQYRCDEQGGLLLRTQQPGATRGKVKLHVLAPVSEHHADAFTGRWLDVMQRHRYRLSVLRLLQDLRGVAVFRTNFPLHPKNVYYGFG